MFIFYPSEIKSLIIKERNIYKQYMFPTRIRFLMAWLKCEPTYKIMQWQTLARISDYYHKKSHAHTASIFSKIAFLWYESKRNRMSLKLGIEIGTGNIGCGLLVYHCAGGIVVNVHSHIGENCHLHGNNCIGNAGPNDRRCPRIGNNVMLGVGAKIIGNVRVADDVIIAAGAVVVKDVLEAGCTVAGIPAKIIKHRYYE